MVIGGIRGGVTGKQHERVFCGSGNVLYLNWCALYIGYIIENMEDLRI